MNKRYTGTLYVKGSVHFQQSSHDKQSLMAVLLHQIELSSDSVHGIVFDEQLRRVVQTFRKDQFAG